MASMARVAALAAAFAGPAEAAFDCTSSGGIYQSITASATTYCAGSCNMDKCCEKNPNVCSHMTVASGCTTNTNKTYTSGSAGKNEAECCTVDKAQCSTFTCPAGYLDGDNKATQLCYGAACGEHDKHQCCKPDTTKCLAHTCTDAKKEVPASKYGTTGNTDADCCVPRKCSSWTAGTGKYVPAAKMTVDGFSDSECSLDMVACSTHTCGTSMTHDGVTAVFYEADSSKTSVKINPEDDTNTKESTCCKLKTTFCYANSATITCAAGKTLKSVNTGTTAAACCVDDMTCATYVPPAPAGGAASGAESAQFSLPVSAFILAAALLGQM